MISAKIIADSVSEQGHRLTTFLLVMPRIVLAEFNTHRMISRNSASSRAIPFEKMVKSVQENPFIPIRWMKEHKGMQGTEYLDEFLSPTAEADWLGARDSAVKGAIQLSDLGVTKQICNRLLEPFMYHTVIATASEWGNFFALRAHPDAEIHMQDLAFKMLDAYNTSEPKRLAAGEWHIPFGDGLEPEKLIRLAHGELTRTNPEFSPDVHALTPNTLGIAVKIATARCARVSYTEVGVSLEGTNYENDIKLHDRLLAAGHMSPFEHCARVMTHEEFRHRLSGEFTVDSRYEEWSGQPGGSTKTFIEGSKGWSGNFRGFIQYRKMLPNENRTDERIKQHTTTTA